MEISYKVQEDKIKDAKNVTFECNIVENPVEYCIFLYNEYLQKGDYKIPIKLMMLGNNLYFKHVTIGSGQNVCVKIIEELTRNDGSSSEDPFKHFGAPQKLTDGSTILYEEKDTNKYFMFLKIDSVTESYSWSEDLSTLELTNENKTCVSFAKWINNKKNEKKVSTGQKASIVALLASIAAAAGSVAMARYKSSKERKRHRVHKYVFDKNNPNYYVPVEVTTDMMPTESEYQVAWNLYKKTMHIAIPRIQNQIVSNTEQLVTFLEKYADRLFPVPAWKNPLFLDNQAKLTTVVLYLNKKNKASEAAVLFWEQFKKDKEIRRPDFIKQLNLFYA
jgi:hypothetical protein